MYTELARKAFDLVKTKYLTDEHRWTKRALAKSEDKLRVDPTGPDAVCWCLQGAIEAGVSDVVNENIKADWKLAITHPKITEIVINAVCDGIKGDWMRPVSHEHWNDREETTWSDVKSLLESISI
jgi:hypothetical protein